MDRLLESVRICGSAALAFVALWAVDMPGGYLGARDTLTEFGFGYTLFLLGMTVAAIAAIWKRPAWYKPASAILLIVNIGVLMPAATADPVLAIFVSIWQLVHMVTQLLPLEVSLPERSPADLRVDDDRLWSWLQERGDAVRHLTLVAIVTTVIVAGYGQTDSIYAYTLCLALHVASIGLSWRYVWLNLESGAYLYGVIWAAGIAGAVLVFSPTLALSVLAISQVLLLGALLTSGPVFEEILTTFFEYPAVLIVMTFLGIILIGTLFLTFPAASATGEPVQPIDALFTATSATCVTGLIVLDTPVDWSLFGHVVILSLIQVGGLGIMTLSTFAMLSLGGKLGLRGEQALGQMLERGDTRSAYDLTKFIVLSTVIIEAIGAIGLAVMYHVRYGYEVGKAAWHGAFHAISAFCNAGFALQSDSIVMFQEDPVALLWIAALITLGGIGFAVLATIWRGMRGDGDTYVSIQTRLVLLASAVLVVGAWGVYLTVEWNASLAGLSVVDRVVNAFFQSVTLRTAGFNSVDFGGLQMATILVMIVVMFIGASPGSTGGGIKTTTAAVLLAGIRAIARGETKIRFFGRSLSQSTVYRSAAIAVLAIIINVVGLFILLLVEDLPLYNLAFETISAVGTVGLSLGATGELGAAGKFVVTALMFIGRIGPLTLALLLTGGEAPPVNYPETDVMVG
ncbi:MAG: TrkH family potassium uptake protein [Myxococcota bacterium]